MTYKNMCSIMKLEESFRERGMLMGEEYKRKIRDMIESVQDVKLLRRIYLMLVVLRG